VGVRAKKIKVKTFGDVVHVGISWWVKDGLVIVLVMKPVGEADGPDVYKEDSVYMKYSQ
jgi:hypothetical protein